MQLLDKNGLKFFVRPHPRYDDEFVLNEIFGEDYYHFKPEYAKGVIIDIGANIGAFSVFASQYGRVLAFEPEPNNRQVLEMNVEINNANVEIFPVALGKPGEDTIENSSGHSRIGDAGGAGVDRVRVMSLDDVPFEHCGFLKMDCEGGEYNIIKYASDETLKKIDIIAAELHSWIYEDKENNQMHKEFMDRLNKFFNVTLSGYKDGNLFATRK